jgi:hypothetical protein
MRMVVIAQQIGGLLRRVRRFDVAGNLGADLRAQRIRRIQLFVISAGIDRRKNREDRLVRVQSYLRRILRKRRKSGEGADKGGQRAAKLETQEKPPKGVRGLADSL